MLTIEQIREAVSKLGKKYGIRNAYLFGSYARGDTKADSDVDIIVDGGKIKHNRDFGAFTEDLDFQEVCAFRAIQIGELVNKLSDKVKDTSPNINAEVMERPNSWRGALTAWFISPPVNLDLNDIYGKI